MIRPLIAAVFLTVAAAPAFACPYSSVSADTPPSTVASQPSSDQHAPPPAAPSDHKQS